MNILITGADGFLGKNLCIYLSNKKKINIYKFNKKNSYNDLREYIFKSSIIFHLAGENRNKNNFKFIQNNVNLTKKIIEIINQKKTKTSLIYASTNQIKKKKNIYTKSKLMAENFLKKNSNKMLLIKVYRFTNIFGKWAKPNHNSVVATFCHNISRRKKIKLSKINEDLEFIFVDKVMELFQNDVKVKLKKKFQIVDKFKHLHKIKLFDLADKIKSFHASRENLLNKKAIAKGFDKLLYSTFLSYVPISQYKYKIKPIKDFRGSFFEFLKSKNNGQISVLTVKPNQTRGNHYHMTKVEKFLVLSGQGEFIFQNIINNSKKKIKVNSREHSIVETIPGWAHNIKNTGINDLIIILWSNEIFNNLKPDTVYYKIN